MVKAWTEEDLESITPSPENVRKLCSEIYPLMHGKHPSEQGAALADCLAMWLAGHPAELREILLDHHVKRVKELLPINVAIIDEASGIKRD